MEGCREGEEGGWTMLGMDWEVVREGLEEVKVVLGEGWVEVEGDWTMGVCWEVGEGGWLVLEGAWERFEGGRAVVLCWEEEEGGWLVLEVDWGEGWGDEEGGCAVMWEGWEVVWGGWVVEE